MTEDIHYNDILAVEICAQISEGAALTTVCKRSAMPSARTVYRWLQEKPEFARLMVQARFDQADTFFAETIEIADALPERDDKGRIDPGWGAVAADAH